MAKLLLPAPARQFVPHRPPMLLIEELIERDIEGNSGQAAATAPRHGLFVGPDSEICTEYFVELIAQTTAAVNGYDALQGRTVISRGFLAGIDSFRCNGGVSPGEKLIIKVKKSFEFGAVTIMEGSVYSENGREVASGKLKLWEDKSTSQKTS